MGFSGHSTKPQFCNKKVLCPDLVLKRGILSWVDDLVANVPSGDKI